MVNIRMGLVEIGWGGVDWIGLAQDRYKWRALVNAIMKLWALLNAGKLSNDCRACGLSSGAQLHRVSKLVEFYPMTVVLQ
jgi:hypothetical protein